MNRRAFLTRSLAFLPLPAFARAASLWLPKERRIVEPDQITDEDIARIHALFWRNFRGNTPPPLMMSFYNEERKLIRLWSGINSVARGGP